MMISMAVITTREAWQKASISISPSARRNFIRFNEARLQAESSRNIYSLQGFEALIRPLFFTGFQWLTVVSNCMPGSPHCQAASDISRSTSLARRVSQGSPVVTFFVE